MTGTAADRTAQRQLFLAAWHFCHCCVRLRLCFVSGLRERDNQGSIGLLRDHLTLLRDRIFRHPIFSGCKGRNNKLTDHASGDCAFSHVVCSLAQHRTFGPHPLFPLAFHATKRGVCRTQIQVWFD
jgi:hypothetical protein